VAVWSRTQEPESQGKRFCPRSGRCSPNYTAGRNGLFGTSDVVRRTNLALGFGGGLDVNLSPHLAIRVLQADYVPTRLGGKWQNDFRVSMSCSFQFGYTENR